MGKTIGIDLGTTNSCVAIYEGKDTTVIPNSEGKKTTPSIVAITPNGLKIGESAKRQSITNPSRTIFSIKRFIGEKYATMKKKAEVMPYKLQASSDGKLMVLIDEKPYTPQEISAYILQKMKKTAEEYLGIQISEAVITVPAYFSETQRQATKEAGVIAGLEVKRILNEPTAAALAFGIKNDVPGKTVVFDFGGGTFDISILDCHNGFYEVMATCGNTHLGGDDFDYAVMKWLIEEFNQEYQINLWEFSEAVQRIKEAAERAKIELSSNEFTEINIPYLMPVDNIPRHLLRTLTRVKFEELISPLMEQCYQPCAQALQTAGITISEIDHVLLVGGSTCIPSVQKMVKNYFGVEPLKCSNPDEIVAVGAALEGAIINKDLDNVILMDVTPLSLGVETEGGIMAPIIIANETIPIRRKEIFTTSQDGQKTVTIHILQGEGYFARVNKSIGYFNLTGIPPMEAGKPQIGVTFDIDKDGLLTVTAQDEDTGNTNMLCIERSGNLSSEEIERMKAEAQANERIDKKRLEWIQAYTRSERNINQIKSWMKQMSHKMNVEDIAILNSLIAQHTKICQEENLQALKCTVKELNTAWENARRNLNKESV